VDDIVVRAVVSTYACLTITSTERYLTATAARNGLKSRVYVSSSFLIRYMKELKEAATYDVSCQLLPDLHLVSFGILFGILRVVR
jgi:hypothetical protein